MERKKLIQETRAVSPVIGVVLMIAIAVILAAVVGTVVLAMGNEPVSTPQASFSFEYDGTELHITHEGGDAIDADNVYVNGSAVEDVGEEWTAGDTESVTAGTGEVIRIVWEDPNIDQSSVIASYEIE